MFDSIQTKFQKKEGGHYLNTNLTYLFTLIFFFF